jgi:hypothetical protein
VEAHSIDAEKSASKIYDADSAAIHFDVDARSVQFECGRMNVWQRDPFIIVERLRSSHHYIQHHCDREEGGGDANRTIELWP